MTGLKKLRSEIRQMTFPEVYQLFDYWRGAPPEHELAAMLARAFTTWDPGEDWERIEDPVKRAVAHRASLERRWKSGNFVSPEQLFKSMGGARIAQHNGRDPGDMPGVGRFPGAPPLKLAA